MNFKSIETVTMINKEVKTSSKTGANYYLYTFISNGKVFPSMYSKVNIDVETGTEVNLLLSLSVYNNNVNFVITGIDEA